MERKINWGIIGAGGIARTFARALSSSNTGWLVAIASREQKIADAFANDFKIAKAHGNYASLLSDKDVNAIYIATPHPMHAEWTIKAAQAGKHVLVEKPIAVNEAECQSMIDAAAASNVFLMEAFMYRCHPQTQKLVELIRDKKIGEVRMIQATFGFHAGFDPQSRLFNRALAGGGIMDVGCYPVSMSRLIAGAATGKEFADPTDVKGEAHLGKSGVDEWAIATLKFPGDILAQISTSVSVNQDNVVKIFGSEGWIRLPNPWLYDSANAEVGKIMVYRHNESPNEVSIEASGTSFTYEADAAGAAILSHKNQTPAMSWNDSLGNTRALDQWRQSVGLVYDFEKRR
ncbi:MAG TPA: Gfo/Idh/MocA family oxidoreductase [Tepidisphaeraceae bacterium]|nr:Gfo/Idh/MocA family oxidoreductase [Tepidisphaeraceae bacterium]